MADNTTLDPGTGGDTIATDDVAGVKYPYAKLVDGTADSTTKIAAGGGVEANALRVTVASDSTGVLSVDDNGGSLTVDGTVSITANSAVNVAQVAGTATSVNSGTKDAGTQRVILASDQTVVPVSDNAGSLTVDAPVGTPAFVRLSDGAAAITALPVTDNSGSLTVDNAGTFAVQDSQKVADNAGFTDGTTLVNPAGYIFDEVAGTALTENDVGASRMDSKRAQVGVLEDATTRGQRAAVSAAGALKVDNSAVTQPVSGTVTANLGTAAVTNAGTFAVQDSEKVADDAAFTVGTTKVLPVGFLADQVSTDSVNEGDIGAARMTLDRKVIVTGAPSSDTEGYDIANNIDVDESEDAVKASAGKLYGWFFYNDGASEVYIKYYNDTVANVVVGTTVPTLTIAIPAGSASNIEWSNGIAFSAAITIAATTAATTADTGAPALNQVVGFSLYK